MLSPEVNPLVMDPQFLAQKASRGKHPNQGMRSMALIFSTTASVMKSPVSGRPDTS